MQFQEAYETLEFNEASNKLEALRVKGNEFVTEKDANKQNALKKWRSLPVIRLRIHKIEQNILDGNNFGDNISALQRIDQIRNLVNQVKFRKVRSS